MRRFASMSDVPALTEFAAESVRLHGPALEIDKDKIRAVVSTAIERGSADPHFVVVQEKDGEIVAALGAIQTPGFWFKGTQVSVLLFHSKEPGAGIALIRWFFAWVKEHPQIKIAVFSVEATADRRIAALLKRVGFSFEYPQMVHIQGVDTCQA